MGKETNKVRDLVIVCAIYVVAYVIGFIPFFKMDNVMLKLFLFDVVATVVTFAFSVILKNSSVYDAYWSLTPMIMSIWLFIETKAFSPWQILFLIAFNIWSVRLTINWCVVFTDFSYEDWRYRKFRAENNPVIWFIINFTGIHMMPTLIVFAGMLPLFEIVKSPLGPLSILGDGIILFGVLLEYFADKQMHKFLNTTKDKVSCRTGLWSYSRHPNYLGEITVWIGVYIAMLPYSIQHWYYGVGAFAVAILFNVVSIPLMEKRQLARREDYADYKRETSRLILRPHKRIK